MVRMPLAHASEPKLAGRKSCEIRNGDVPRPGLLVPCAVAEAPSRRGEPPAVRSDIWWPRA